MDKREQRRTEEREGDERVGQEQGIQKTRESKKEGVERWWKREEKKKREADQ